MSKLSENVLYNEVPATALSTSSSFTVAESFAGKASPALKRFRRRQPVRGRVSIRREAFCLFF